MAQEKLILLADVDNLGLAGEAVHVAAGYARNYLLPRKLASEATADAINAIKLKEKAKAAQAAKEKAVAQEYAERLEAVQVTIRAKAGNGGKLFGAVTSEAISKALKEQFDMDIEKNKIVQSEPIKSYGSYTVKAKLGYEVSGNISVLVVEG